MGIKTALEMYQRAMDEMLEGLDHAYAIMDDILVARRDISHHDSVLEKATLACQELQPEA